MWWRVLRNTDAGPCPVISVFGRARQEASLSAIVRLSRKAAHRLQISVTCLDPCFAHLRPCGLLLLYCLTHTPAWPAPGIPGGDWYRNSQLRVSGRLISSRSFPRQTMRQWRAGGSLRKTAGEGEVVICVRSQRAGKGAIEATGQPGPSTQPAPGTL